METCATTARRRWDAAAGSVHHLSRLVRRRGDVVDEGGFGHPLLWEKKNGKTKRKQDLRVSH